MAGECSVLPGPHGVQGAFAIVRGGSSPYGPKLDQTTIILPRPDLFVHPSCFQSLLSLVRLSSKLDFLGFFD